MSDPYFDLPPMHPPSGAPPEHAPSAATDSPTEPIDDAVDDDSLDFSVPDDDDTEDAGDDDEGEDGEESGDDDREWLLARAKQADAYERQMAQLQGQQQEQQAVAYWNARLGQIESELQAEEAAIYANAENSLNPIGYLRKELTALHNKATARYGEYRDAREQALWQFAHAQAIPAHAARVVEHFKLPPDTVEELLNYAPEQMEYEAGKIRARLINERKYQKQIRQLRAKQARQAIGAPVAPGAGRAGAGAADGPKLGSDAHYMSIPWTRG